MSHGRPKQKSAPRNDFFRNREGVEPSSLQGLSRESAGLIKVVLCPPSPNMFWRKRWKENEDNVRTHGRIPSVKSHPFGPELSAWSPRCGWGRPLNLNASLSRDAQVNTWRHPYFTVNYSETFGNPQAERTRTTSRRPWSLETRSTGAVFSTTGHPEG